MANHKSAKKRARQDRVRNLRNKSYISAVRTSVKKLRVGIDGLKAGKTQVAEVETLFSSAKSTLEKAANKGRLHRNNVKRRISRLALALNKAVTK